MKQSRKRNTSVNKSQPMREEVNNKKEYICSDNKFDIIYSFFICIFYKLGISFFLM